jgi:hypothetical protein
LGNDDERFKEQTDTMVKALRQPGGDIAATKLQLVNYGHRLSFVAEDQSEIKVVLLKLLHMVFENIADLSPDELWLKGQMEALVTASEPPLSLRRLDDVERRLKDVIFKQKEAKERAVQAQTDLRDMLKAFIERLSEITQSTGTFHEKLEESARLIEQAKSMEEIAPPAPWPATAKLHAMSSVPCASVQPPRKQKLQNCTKSWTVSVPRRGTTLSPVRSTAKAWTRLWSASFQRYAVKKHRCVWHCWTLTISRC